MLHKLLSRLDGWGSLLKKFGDPNRDPVAGSEYEADTLLPLARLEALHRHNGIAANVAERPAQDATRKGWRLESADLDLEPVQQRLRRLKIGKGKRGLRLAIQKALEKSRGFGGAGLVLGIKDGLPPEVPVDERAILDVTYALPVRGDLLRPLEIETNPESELFGSASLYEFISEEDAQVRRIHGSRVIPFVGVDLEYLDSQTAPCLGWGDSVHQRLYRELRNTQMTEDGGVRTLLESNIPVLQFEGLTGLMGTEKGEEKVNARMTILAATKSILRVMLIDGKDLFSYQSASLAGYDSLLNIYPNRVAAVSGIPYTFLYGVSPGGLNATGESDIRNYYDRVLANIILPHVVPAVERVARLLMLASQGPTRGVLPASWEVIPNPLWELTEKEQAEVELLHAQKDKIYVVDLGNVDREEVRQSRFGQQGWRSTLTLDEKAREATKASQQSSAGLPPEVALQQGRLAEWLLFTDPFAEWAAKILGAPVPTAAEKDAFWARQGKQAPQPGDPRLDAAERLMRSLAPLVNQSSKTRLDASGTDGFSVGLFFPLPPLLASQRPPLAQDTSPPHVTYLFVGDVKGREQELVALVERVLGGEDLHPVRFQFGDVDSLITRSGERVHYQHVHGPHIWSLYDARWRLVELLQAEGFGIADIAPRDWLPHLTLSYDPDPHAPWTGASLAGSWTAQVVEIWGLGPEPVRVTLGPPPASEGEA